MTSQDIVNRALTQDGKPYIFGYEVNLKDPNPKAYDCSELVEWACYQEGVHIPDGAANQFRFCQRHGQEISLEDAVSTPGALLFRISKRGNHVAISQGKRGEVFDLNGNSLGEHWLTIEARGKAWGVGQWEADRPGFTHAALIPGVDYGEEWA